MKPAVKRGSATARLDKLGIEAFVELVLAGQTMKDIAAQVGVSRGGLVHWLAADPDRSAQAREANMVSAAAFDDMAETAIMGATDALSLAKAKELAQHYRWRASKRDVQGFGDKVGIGGATGLPPIQTTEPMPLMELARRAAFLFAKAVDAEEPIRLVRSEPLQLGHSEPDPMTAYYGLPGGKLNGK
jgi:hypothetical protein